MDILSQNSSLYTYSGDRPRHGKLESPCATHSDCGSIIRSSTMRAAPNPYEFRQTSEVLVLSRPIRGQFLLDCCGVDGTPNAELADISGVCWTRMST